MTGKSIGDILREAVGVQRQSAGLAYKRGRTEGWNAALMKYAVVYPCSICEQNIVVESDDEKKAVARYMRESGWGHSTCNERPARLRP